MQLMGRYAAANHQLIHQGVADFLSARVLARVENHHNFAWKEEHDNQTVIVHRKGATPAHKGQLGIIPGSMGTAGFVVRGLGHSPALNSCSHGAGRLMSRQQANKKFKKINMRALLQEMGVDLISGGKDEAPWPIRTLSRCWPPRSKWCALLPGSNRAWLKWRPASNASAMRLTIAKAFSNCPPPATLCVAS